MQVLDSTVQTPGREHQLPTNGFEIRPLQPGEDSTAFRTLNEEWINSYFTLEEHDRDVLSNPERLILREGGSIFMGHYQGRRVACVALIAMGQGVYELSKMAVSPELRGLGLGRKLLSHAIERARDMGANSLFLGSSTKLKNAVHLYEAAGFRHVAPETLPLYAYQRANVFMRLVL